MSNFKEMYNSFTNYINNTLGQRGGRLLLSMASISVLFWIYYKYFPDRDNLDSLGFLGIPGKYVYYTYASISFITVLYGLVFISSLGHHEGNIKIEPGPTSQVIKLLVFLFLFGLFFYIMYALHNNSEWINLQN